MTVQLHTGMAVKNELLLQKHPISAQTIIMPVFHLPAAW